MANPEHLAILKQGVKKWNQWREEDSTVEPDLAGARLVNADLNRAKLGKANLSGADLTHAHLCRAELVGAELIGAKLLGANLIDANVRTANLKGASLRKAKLAQADFSNTSLDYSWVIGVGTPVGRAYPADLGEANLTDAKLIGANLTGANLSRANLAGTNFNGASISGTHFDDVDLSVATGLETVDHLGPSTVGIDTIHKSKGKIPDVFLRGCGVPDELIGYIKSIAGAIHYYSCFISYSSKDQSFADRLYADLQAKGVRCWFAPHDMRGGEEIHEQVDEAIRVHEKVLIILSDASIASQWVKTELGKTLKRERHEGKRVLFPIRLVPFKALEEWEYIDSSGEDIAEKIRRYYIPDFSDWKNHGSYQTAFQTLVEDLKS